MTGAGGCRRVFREAVASLLSLLFLLPPASLSASTNLSAPLTPYTNAMREDAERARVWNLAALLASPLARTFSRAFTLTHRRSRAARLSSLERLRRSAIAIERIGGPGATRMRLAPGEPSQNGRRTTQKPVTNPALLDVEISFPADRALFLLLTDKYFLVLAVTPISKAKEYVEKSALLDEKLVLADGGELYEAPFTADLVLYHLPLTAEEQGTAAPEAAGAMLFKVSPSPRAAQVLLRTGYDNIRLYPFPDQLDRGSILGPAGGSVTSPDGTELLLAEGALAQRTIVKALRLSDSELSSLPLIDGFDTVAAVRVDLAGQTLARPATLKIPVPQGLANDSNGFALATFVEAPADGRASFARAIARASRSGSPEKLVATPEPDATALPLEGLIREGVYLFLKAKAPIAWSWGLVTAENGYGLTSARVSAATLGTADLTVPGGAYAIPIPAPTATLTAIHPTRDERGTATLTNVATASIIRTDIVIHAVAPTITSVQPAENAINQPVGSVVVVRFSEPLDPSTVTSTTLTAEIANSDGTASGASFLGTVTLSPDRTAITFTPARPLPPSRKILCRFLGGVRDAGGTPYSGTTVQWAFTTSSDVVFGGQVHAERFHIEIPVDGKARIWAEADAMPRVPAGTAAWSVWCEIEGPVDPAKDTIPAATDGSIVYILGHPPAFAVTITSKVWVHVIDPTGTEAAAFRLGPFVTPDKKSFVAPPDESVTFISADGIQVTSPEGAFDEATMVKVTKRDTSTIDIPAPAGMQYGAWVDVDFEGTARKTLRLKIPVDAAASGAPIGSLAFAGEPVTVAWGRALKLFEIGSIIDGGGGAKLISTAEADQPADPALGSKLLRPASALGPLDTQLPRKLIQTTYAEYVARASAVFMLQAGAELSAMVVNPMISGLMSNYWLIYNWYADTLVYFPLPFNWSGHAILPITGGAPIQMVQRDASTGWILLSQQFDPFQPGAGPWAGEITMTAEPAAPKLSDARPFAFHRFSAASVAGEESCSRLSLELQGCSTSQSQAKVKNVDAFPFAKGTRLTLYNTTQSWAKGGRTEDASTPFALSVSAKAGDEVLALVEPSDLDSETTRSLLFSFDRALTNVTSEETLVKLIDCGEAEKPSCGASASASTIPLETKVDGSSITSTLAASLGKGRLYKVLLDAQQLSTKASGTIPAKPYLGPTDFTLQTRAVIGDSIGSSSLSVLEGDNARDMLKIGNLLLVGGSNGQVVAVDVSSPTSPTLFAKSTGVADTVRGFATDGHGRLFYNAQHGNLWGVSAIRIEDVRSARLQGGLFAPTVGGVTTAISTTETLLGPEYTAWAGSLPFGTPTAMDLAVEDLKSEPKELKAFYDSFPVQGQPPFSDLTPDSSGVYTFGVPIDLNVPDRRPGVTNPCDGENPWYHFQRATVANLTTGETWSFDVENPWPSGTGSSRLEFNQTSVIRARRGDQLQIRYNLRTYGYIAVMGSGLTVVDLNRMYRTVLSGGAAQKNKAQCGRHLARYEGAELPLPADPSGAGYSGLSQTPAVVVLGTTGSPESGGYRGSGRLDAFSPLLRTGPVHAWSPETQPGEITAEVAIGIVPGPRFRDVAVAPDIERYEGTRLKRSDLAFYSMGATGIASFDVSERRLGSPIGRFLVPGHYSWRLQYDATRKRLYAGGTDEAGKAVIDVFDATRAEGYPRDGQSDSRLLFSVHAPWDTNHIAVDESGNGLLFTWDNQNGKGALSIPVDDPRFVFVGLYRAEGDESPSTSVSISKVALKDNDSYLVPFGVPTRAEASAEKNDAKRAADERKATALVKVRVALPGNLGETIQAKVQSLRVLPDEKSLAKENVGAAASLPGGPGWPEREKTITLKKLSKEGALESDPNGKTSIAHSLYESVETLALIADPRAKKGYTRQTGDGKTDEATQCRRCERPSFAPPDTSVLELLAGGPYVRAFLPDATAASDFFTSKGENYRTPRGAATLVGWADEVPSPIQAALAEPAQNPAIFGAEAGASVALTSGEALLETTDHSVKGRGVGFAFDRTYRSGMLGYGAMGSAPWNSSLFSHLRFTPLVGEAAPGQAPTRRQIAYHDGAGHVFTLITTEDGTCPDGYEKESGEESQGSKLCLPKGLYVTLESLGDKGWRLLGRTHDAAYFDSRGNLAAISDRLRQDEADPTKQGSTLQLYRDGFGQLASAEDDLGRGYRFTYEESPTSAKYGLLATLTDFDSRKLTYLFDAQRKLKSVELPQVEAGLPVLTYTYSTASLSQTAPHHGDFSELKLQSYALPGSATPRVTFTYDPASARVSDLGVAEVTKKWVITPASSAAPATMATITAPFGLISQYTLENGRVTNLDHLNMEVAKGGSPTSQRVSSQIEYHPKGDGRIKTVTRGDGGTSTYAYPDDAEPKTHRMKRLNAEKVTDQGGDAGEAITRFPSYNVDNIADKVTDAEGRDIKEAVAEPPSAAEPEKEYESGYLSETPAVTGKTRFDRFGRPKSVKGGTGDEETKLELTFKDDKRGKPQAGYVDTVKQGCLSETYDYDERGNVTSVTTSQKTKSIAQYDAWDRPVLETTGISTGSLKDASSTVKRSYYLSGLLEKEEREQKREDGSKKTVTTKYTYNERGEVRFIDEDGLAAETPGAAATASAKTEYRYDGDTGLLKEVVSPKGLVTSYRYDTAGRVKEEQTASSSPRKSGYDELGRASWAHNGDEAEWKGTYDKLGRLTNETHPTGASVTRHFDLAGGLKSQEITGPGSPGGTLSSIEAHVTSFGAVDTLKEKQDASGDQSSTLEVKRTFDTNGRLKEQTSSGRLDARLGYETETGKLKSLEDSSEKTTFDYECDSPWPKEVKRYEAPSGGSCGSGVPTTTSQLTRDALGRVTGELSSDGTQTTADYDEDGRPLFIASSAGATSTFSWDSAGALLNVTRPQGRGATSYGYDLDGRMVGKSAIAGSGETYSTTYDYDTSGRLWHVRRAGQGEESFGYYPDDVVKTHTRRDGSVVTFGYDPANRVISAVPAGSAGAPNAPLLDAGQSFQWDGLSRLLGSQRLGAAGANARTSVAFTGFDQAGRPKYETLGERNALTRTYDLYGRTKELALPVGIGAHAALSYIRGFEGCSKRLLTLTASGVPSAVNASLNAALGATWAWSGDGRILGITTNGPLKTAHRYGYIEGPGAQPNVPAGVSPARWRLGTLTVGTAGTTDPAKAATLGEGDSKAWGQFQYGYRENDNAKLGRQVMPAASGVSILANQGWAFKPDVSGRLLEAHAGKGSVEGVSVATVPSALERFTYAYGKADQLTNLARQIAMEDVIQEVGLEGRPTSRTAFGLTSEIKYDGEGRRVEDDRLSYRWWWFGKLAEVRVKDSWPSRKAGEPPFVSPYAGHLIKWEYDSLGRTFSRTHLGKLPQGVTDDCARPFIERREFLWEGANLLGEAGYGPGGGACWSTAGPIRWRKSYVPGASGLDDQVQVRVEIYGASSEPTSDKLYSFLRDELQSVLSLVEEKDGGDPAKPNVPVRFVYTPYGEAHVELGPEIRKARFEALVTSLGSQNQVTSAGFIGGAMVITFSVPIDVGTLAGGAIVERRLTDGTWGALTASELALGRGTEPEQLVLLPLAGWQLGTTYRVRLTNALKDESGRALASAEQLDLAFPAAPAGGEVGSTSFSFERVYPVEYESWMASGETVGGLFPGGVNLGWQGHWVDPVTGLHMVRARVYCPRTASFLTSDPESDKDSPGLYGYVAGKPHSARDPFGLQEEPTGTEMDEITGSLRQRARGEAINRHGKEIAEAISHGLELGLYFIPGFGPVMLTSDVITMIERGEYAKAALIVGGGYLTVRSLVYLRTAAPKIWRRLAKGERVVAGEVEAVLKSRAVAPEAAARMEKAELERAMAGPNKHLAEADEAAGVRASRRAETAIDDSLVSRIQAKLGLYPKVIDPRTGRHIHFPSGIQGTVPKASRVAWDAQERADFIAEWYRRGYPTPRGGWDKYDIHHVLPREFGGTNDFWNLVPVERGAHQREFNAFWREFIDL